MTGIRIKKRALVFSVVYWILASYYFVTISYFGLEKFAGSELHYGNLVGYSAAVGFFIGLLFGFFPLHHLSFFRKRRSFLKVILTGTGLYVLFFMLVIFLSSLYGNSFGFAASYLFSPGGLIVLFHLSLASLFYHFLLQINKKFGPGVLLKYTLGSYFSPRVEERVFMFLDLKSSTSLAEALEHVSYSRMVQECYAELTAPLLYYRAQVYQYVGDEVVISWKMHPYFYAASCYEFFYAFRDRLEAKKNYFLAHYGVYPQFKAGIHCGKVTVAEVGEIKTEIAYHGDVVNTASRIQNLCNQFQAELLFSESFLQQLPETHQNMASFVADTALKGKETSTKIFTIAALDSIQLLRN